MLRYTWKEFKTPEEVLEFLRKNENIIKLFRGLDLEKRVAVIESFLKEDKKAEDLEILQLAFFKGVQICNETNAETLELKWDFAKIWKKAKLKITLSDL